MYVDDIDTLSVLQDWAERLRSGQYRQGRHRLRGETFYCPFGVLAESLIWHGFPARWIADDGAGNGDGFHGKHDSRGRKVWETRPGKAEGFVLRYMGTDYRRELPRDALIVSGFNTFDKSKNGGWEWWRYLQDAGDRKLAPDRLVLEGQTVELGMSFEDLAGEIDMYRGYLKEVWG